MKRKYFTGITEYIFCVLILVIAVSLAGCSLIRSAKMRDSDNSDYVVLDEIPEWSGSPYVEINGNSPDFDDDEIRWAEQNAAADGEEAPEIFTEMDRYGRCGAAVACVGPETMPDGERGPIGMIRPSGWRLDKYDFIDNGGYLYNRCHLIGWQLTGQNAEERNLITGTRYMNTEGMLPLENRVAEYVRSTGNHVLYRVTPMFRGKDLVARGVDIEAYSLEDGGKGVSYNVYCYNVQPGVKIDYRTGKNKLDEATLPESADADQKEPETDTEDAEDRSGSKDTPAADLEIPDGVTYILNNNTMRFHRTDCKGARDILEHNREWFYGSREEAIEEGYVPCGMCQP